MKTIQATEAKAHLAADAGARRDALERFRKRRRAWCKLALSPEELLALRDDDRRSEGVAAP